MAYSELPYNGNYPPGVTDNDPYFTDESEDDEEEDDEPRRPLVKCSYPGCERMTTLDPTYGDLCYKHIRAENE